MLDIKLFRPASWHVCSTHWPILDEQELVGVSSCQYGINDSSERLASELRSAYSINTIIYFVVYIVKPSNLSRVYSRILPKDGWERLQQASVTLHEERVGTVGGRVDIHNNFNL